MMCMLSQTQTRSHIHKLPPTCCRPLLESLPPSHAPVQVRPVWLSPSVHVFNFLLAWTDTAFASPRSFTRRAELLSTGLITGYIAIILGSRYFNGMCWYRAFSRNFCCPGQVMSR